MPVPVEHVVPGRCFRANDQKLRKVLIINGNHLTYIIHHYMAWTVQRFYETPDSFAAGCVEEIDCNSCHAKPGDIDTTEAVMDKPWQLHYKRWAESV